MRIKQLKRPFARCPTKWFLCTSEEELHNTQKNAGLPHSEFQSWVVGGTLAAATHMYDGVIIVCAPLDCHYSDLIHEAVHVWQGMMREVGEDNPGWEMQAYGIQHLATELIAALRARQPKTENTDKQSMP